MKNSTYITTTLPYVNAEPHIGFALEIVQADCIARFWLKQGREVFFNTGTDEHGQKIFRKAQEEGEDTKNYVDKNAKKFTDLKAALNLSYTNFIRTTQEDHKKAAQEFWKRCLANGDIEKKLYKIKYCVGCELEKTESELVDGHCPLHPDEKIQINEEENYFFKFSRYQKKLLDLYDKNPEFVVPDFRLKEIKNFVEQGLEDFSISRLKNKMPWGVDVPDDPDHVIYVWFDALVNYISALGWPNNKEKFEKFWPGYQIAGKDNLRQQAAMWQAMLLSAGLLTSEKIIIHGFITSSGKKISKSVGNMVDPFELVRKYGADAVRYYLLREIPPFDDGDYSQSRMEEIYDSDLANELGNLVQRVTTLGEKDQIELNEISTKEDLTLNTYLEKFEFNKALEHIWTRVKRLNKKIDDFAPWEKESSERLQFLKEVLSSLNQIGNDLMPFIPDTAQEIIKFSSGKIKKAPSLFPKK